MIQCALISGKGMGLMHGRNFHNHPDAQVIAVCDMDPELLAKAKAEFGVPGYVSIDELLANCDAELMLLIVNETRRIPPLRQLLAAGRNVFTEKPLCGLEGQYRLREEDAAIAAPAIQEWRLSGLKFGIDFNYRFFHHFRKLHDDVAEGRLGEIRMVRARAHFNCWSHVIDQILWTMGLPEWVSVIGNPNERGGWQRMIHIKWANGVVGALDGTNLWGSDDHLLRIMIVGEKSYAEARGLDGWYRRSKSNNSEVEELWEAETGKPEMSQSFPRMADGVIQAMLADTAFPADGQAAWNELLFEAAVHRSALNDGARVLLADVEKATMGAL
ncbi:Gfo/Idh/MocA family oxidoreductase [Candidatus Poribacteria bacterium]|nr:Gfo/Idh/MocA family oxidoreductase [Candidatus Poribacteria bacterium]